MTNTEVNRRSTPEERAACALYNKMRAMEWMEEGDILQYQQAVSILVARNQRLGLIKGV